MFWSIVGIGAAILTTFAFIPQIIKIHKTRSAHDVSAGTLLQLLSGVALWIAYGAYLKNAIIVTANVVTFVCLVVALVLYFRFR